MPKNEKEPVDLDPILGELGSFGRYQMMMFAYILLPIFFTSLHITQFIFAAGAVDYR